MSDSSRPYKLYSVHGISQARILEWVPFPSPGDLLDPGIQPGPPAFQAGSLPLGLPRKPAFQLKNKDERKEERKEWRERERKKER